MESRPTPEITVVVPLYNELESLPELHRLLSETVAGMGCEAEFIFVDDGSTDGSFGALRDLHERDSRVRVVQFRRNYGKSAALAQGFALARGTYVVTMDADLQDDPAEIPQLVARIEEGYDVVSGWKKERYDPFIKRITSKLFNAVTGAFTGVHLHDMNCGLKIYRREVVQSISVYGQRHRFLPVLAAEEGFRIGEKVVKHHPRKFGKTKFGPSRFLSGFLDLVTLLFLSRYVKRPLHLFGGFGLVSTLLGGVICVILAWDRIFYAKYLSNRPLLFLGVTLVIVGVQFVSLGLVGEMITQTNSSELSYSIRATLGLADSQKA